jgi:hypothetical protein
VPINFQSFLAKLKKILIVDALPNAFVFHLESVSSFDAGHVRQLWIFCAKYEITFMRDFFS